MSGFQPDGRHTVTPRIITPDPAGLVAFVKTVFGAGGEHHTDAPSEVALGDSTIMISDGGGLRTATPGFLYVYVEDVDATYRRAIDAGAVSIEAPLETPYGDRRATIRDAWGDTWQIATHKGGQ